MACEGDPAFVSLGPGLLEGYLSIEYFDPNG